MNINKYLQFLLLIIAVGALTIYSSCRDDSDQYYYYFLENGADSGTGPTDINGGGGIIMPQKGTQEKTGCFFNGWIVKIPGTSAGSYAGGHYNPGDMYASTTYTSNDFYSDWRFYITYDGNGNTGGVVPVDNIKHYGGTEPFSNSDYSNTNFAYALNSGNLVKTGYTLAGWNTKADGTGTNYGLGETNLAVTVPFMLYARWVPEGSSYSVTYDGNGNTGGTVPTDNNVYSLGNTVTVKANTGNLVRTNYIFTGWNTQANGSGTHYNSDGTTTFSIGDASVTLYAEWSPVYTVTYDGNGSTGGTVPVDNNTYQQGANVTVLGNSGTLLRTGYTFAGWNTNASATGNTYEAAATFMMGNANVTLYAKWQVVPSTYTVTYNGNGNSGGGSVPIDNISYDGNATVTVLGNSGNLQRDGFTFGGWSTELSPVGPPPSGTVFQPGETFTITSNVTLYAVWLFGGGVGGPGIYQVIYEGNGNTDGSVPVDNNFYETGATVSVAGNQLGQLMRTGFTFNGWNTAADGTGTHYAGDGTDFLQIDTSNVTLYAEWR